MNEPEECNLEEGIIFKSKLSDTIGGVYWLSLGVTILLIIVTSAVEMSILVLIEIFLLERAYNVKFTVTEDQIIIDSIFREMIIDISDVRSVEKVPIRPGSGFVLAGANLLGGWYSFPKIGKAYVAATNYRDGVLITTKENKHYIITPETPLEFIKTVEVKML